MAKRMLASLCAFLALVLMMATSVARADQAVILGAQGQPANFPQINVESAARGADGQLVLMVVPNPGQPAAPLPISRIQSIAFGNSGEGRTFDMTLSADGGGTSFHPGTIVQQFAGGRFTAVPTGGTQAFPIEASRIVSLAGTSVQLSPTPAPFDQAESFTNDDPGTETDGFDGSGPMDGEFAGDDFESLSTQEKGMLAALLGGSILILVGLLFFCLSYLATLVWLIVWCLKEGDISGVFVLLCCSFGKWYYAFSKYDGPGRLAMQILNGIEVLMWVVLMVLQGVLGA